MITDYGAVFLRSRQRPAALRAFARDSVLWRLDWPLLLSALALCSGGLLLIWSATRTQLLASGADPQYFMKRQGLFAGVGVLLAMGAMSFDFRLLRAFAPLIYAVSCFLLLVVLTPLGVTINGAKSWLGLPGGFALQPSEFAKVALVLLLAMLLGEIHDGENDPRDRDVVQALALAALPTGLILIQPDLGTGLVFGAIVLGMVAVSGAPRRWLFGMVAGVAGAGAGLIYFQVLEPYQLARFTAFANPEGAPEAITYSAEQARLAIGSGGVFGKGLANGSLTSGQFVPEQQSDFIFTVAGEEFGFLGCAVIVALIGMILWRGLRIAARAEDAFGLLIAAGVVCWFGFQAFQNIGMTIGLMPVTGLPLPFVSYGGSAMMANLLAVGLLQNIHLSTSRRNGAGGRGATNTHGL